MNVILRKIEGETLFATRPGLRAIVVVRGGTTPMRERVLECDHLPPLLLAQPSLPSAHLGPGDPL